jgi:hypothetical protein
LNGQLSLASQLELLKQNFELHHETKFNWTAPRLRLLLVGATKAIEVISSKLTTTWSEVVPHGTPCSPGIDSSRMEPAHVGFFPMRWVWQAQMWLATEWSWSGTPLPSRFHLIPQFEKHSSDSWMKWSSPERKVIQSYWTTTTCAGTTLQGAASPRYSGDDSTLGDHMSCASCCVCWQAVYVVF